MLSPDGQVPLNDPNPCVILLPDEMRLNVLSTILSEVDCHDRWWMYRSANPTIASAAKTPSLSVQNAPCYPATICT